MHFDKCLDSAQIYLCFQNILRNEAIFLHSFVNRYIVFIFILIQILKGNLPQHCFGAKITDAKAHAPLTNTFYADEAEDHKCFIIGGSGVTPATVETELTGMEFHVSLLTYIYLLLSTGSHFKVLSAMI